MNIKTQSPLTVRSRKLRRNMTPEERHLWYDCLKTLPLTFHRQKIIGPFIADFCCDAKKLVIEIDGLQHQTDEGIEYDKKRDSFLSAKGYRVIRFTNEDINRSFNAVCKEIMELLEI